MLAIPAYFFASPIDALLIILIGNSQAYYEIDVMEEATAQEFDDWLDKQ